MFVLEALTSPEFPEDPGSCTSVPTWDPALGGPYLGLALGYWNMVLKGFATLPWAFVPEELGSEIDASVGSCTELQSPSFLPAQCPHPLSALG